MPAKPFRDPTVRSPALVGPPDATLSSEIATRDGLHVSEPRLRRFADRQVSPSAHGGGTRARASSLRRGGGVCTDAQKQETRSRNLISWGWECQRASLVLYLQQLPSLHGEGKRVGFGRGVMLVLGAPFIEGDAKKIIHNIKREMVLSLCKCVWGLGWCCVSLHTS